MQRPTENLHRATPVPILEHLPHKRSGPTFSVGSIPEDGEEAETVSHEKADTKGWPSRVKNSPSLAGREAQNNGILPSEMSGRDMLGVKAGLRKPFSLSSQSSPTGSVDSQGSGMTSRSHESLHRPTPIPMDAANSLTMAPSIGKRSGGRLQPSTPTINESEDLQEELLDTDQDFLARNESLGNRSNSSLHRATPVPTDLSTSSTGTKFTGHCHKTPTIEEHDADRYSELDSSEHYYGMSHRRTEPNKPEAQRLSEGSGTLDSKAAGTGSTSHRHIPADSLSQIKVASEDQRAEGHIPAVPIVALGNKGATPSTEGAPQLQAQAASPFSPIVDSKEWERDILGVARFLRMCPGLSRQLIGDILGENNERCLRVLECFTASFDFTDLSFEAALREYLESFRLPGESQKIYRILESWSRQFFRQCPGFFRTADAALILAFSLILLNTDKHNRTVKQKMTCNQFLKNMRGTNDGQDFPQDFLEDLFRSIERRAIRMPPAHHAESLLQRHSLPEPLRSTQARYDSPKKSRARGFLCF